MELFHNDGHLTEEGLLAVTNGTLDEMESLEASEHLGFCCLCLERYLALMDTQVLLTPATSLNEKVQKRLARKTKRISFSRYITVAVAACLALVMWGGGFYSSLQDGEQNMGARVEEERTARSEQALAEDAPTLDLASRLNRAAMALPSAMNDLFGMRPSPITDPAGKDQTGDAPSATPPANSTSTASTASGSSEAQDT